MSHTQHCRHFERSNWPLHSKAPCSQGDYHLHTLFRFLVLYIRFAYSWTSYKWNNIDFCGFFHSTRSFWDLTMYVRSEFFKVLLSNYPWDDYTTICLSVLLLIFRQYFATISKAAVNIFYTSFFGRQIFSFFLSRYLEVELLHHNM